MDSSAQFVDYYRVLGVDPSCDARTLEASYHAQAKRYHPDHSATADVAMFAEVVEAYRALREPESRAAYNEIYEQHIGFAFQAAVAEPSEVTHALSDAEAHAKLLHQLYRRRRENAQDPAVGRFFVQEMLGCSDEVFEFHLWYLKEKGLIAVTEQGTLVITILGVDHVIALSQTARKEQLRIGQSVQNADEPSD